jgi:hypothetical protein
MFCFFYENIRESNFFVDILTEDAFVTQLSNNTGTSVLRTVWVRINFGLMIDLQ